MRQRFDVVLCGHRKALPLAAGLARVSGARLWVQVHGIEAWDRRGPLARASLATASLVTSVSLFTRRRRPHGSDVPPERVRVLPNTYAGCSPAAHLAATSSSATASTGAAWC